jgi:hypothetical protein
VEKTGKKRPWKSQERFPLSHSFNNNKLDDRDHFQQNAKTSVASLRGLIGSSRNTDRHHSGMLIDFIGIPTLVKCGVFCLLLSTTGMSTNSWFHLRGKSCSQGIELHLAAWLYDLLKPHVTEVLVPEYCMGFGVETSVAGERHLGALRILVK